MAKRVSPFDWKKLLGDIASEAKSVELVGPNGQANVRAQIRSFIFENHFLQSLSDAVVVMDAHCIIRGWNQAAESVIWVGDKRRAG